MKKHDVLVELPFCTFWLSDFRGMGKRHRDRGDVDEFYVETAHSMFYHEFIQEIYDTCNEVIANAYIELKAKYGHKFKVKGAFSE